MNKTRVAVEVIVAMGVQYGLSKLLAAVNNYAEDGDKRELGTYPQLPGQRLKA